MCGMCLARVRIISGNRRCTLCKANYTPKYKGSKCQNCLIGEVGGDAQGLDESACLSRVNLD
jgi:hypothetical protein